jgi:hypothetical protein
MKKSVLAKSWALLSQTTPLPAPASATLERLHIG